MQRKRDRTGIAAVPTLDTYVVDPSDFEDAEEMERHAHLGTGREAINVMRAMLQGDRFQPVGQTSDQTFQSTTLYGIFPCTPDVPNAFIMNSAYVMNAFRMLQLLDKTAITKTNSQFGLGIDKPQPATFGVFQGMSSTTPIFPGGCQLTLNGSYFFRVTQDQAIQIQPDVNKTFSDGLAYSGCVSIKSDSQNTQTTVISGTISYSSMPDIGGKNLKFEPPAMKQQCTDLKSAIMNESVKLGAHCIFGTDYWGQPRPLQFEDNSGVKGIYTTTLTDVFSGSVLAPDFGSSGAYLNSCVSSKSAAWISPFSTCQFKSSQDTAVSTTHSYDGLNISPIDAPSYTFTVQGTYTPPTGSMVTPQGWQEFIASAPTIGFVRVINYFIQSALGLDGSRTCVWMTTVDNKPVTFQVNSVSSPDFANGSTWGYSGTASSGTPISPVIGGATQFLTSDCKVPEGFQWFGSFIHCVGANSIEAASGSAPATGPVPAGEWLTGPTPSVGFGTPSTGGPALGGFSFELVQCDQSAQHASERGILSGWRVVRVDNAAAGQNIMLDGTVQFYGNSKDRIAPYTNRTEREDAVHPMALPIHEWIRLLLDSPQSGWLRRNLTYAERDGLLAIFEKILSEPPEDIDRHCAKIALHTGNRNIIAHAAGLGFFNSIGNLAKKGISAAAAYLKPMAKQLMNEAVNQGKSKLSELASDLAADIRKHASRSAEEGADYLRRLRLQRNTADISANACSYEANAADYNNPILSDMEDGNMFDPLAPSSPSSQDELEANAATWHMPYGGFERRVADRIHVYSDPGRIWRHEGLTIRKSATTTTNKGLSLNAVRTLEGTNAWLPYIIEYEDATHKVAVDYLFAGVNRVKDWAKVDQVRKVKTRNGIKEVTGGPNASTWKKYQRYVEHVMAQIQREKERCKFVYKQLTPTDWNIFVNKQEQMSDLPYWFTFPSRNEWALRFAKFAREYNNKEVKANIQAATVLLRQLYNYVYIRKNVNSPSDITEASLKNYVLKAHWPTEIGVQAPADIGRAFDLMVKSVTPKGWAAAASILMATSAEVVEALSNSPAFRDGKWADGISIAETKNQRIPRVPWPQLYAPGRMPFHYRPQYSVPLEYGVSEATRGRRYVQSEISQAIPMPNVPAVVHTQNQAQALSDEDEHEGAAHGDNTESQRPAADEIQAEVSTDRPKYDRKENPAGDYARGYPKQKEAQQPRGWFGGLREAFGH